MTFKHPVKLLSCDNHLEHWPTVLKDYIPQKYHGLFDTAPHMVKMFGQVPHYGPDGVCTSVLAIDGEGLNRPKPGNGLWNDIFSEALGAHHARRMQPIAAVLAMLETQQPIRPTSPKEAVEVVELRQWLHGCTGHE